jgi:hypothetical protein
VPAVPPTVLGLTVYLAVGLGDPDCQPPAKAVPVGVLPTEAQTPSRVNEVDEAVTRDSRRPGQRERASAVPVGSTSSGWTGGDTSGTLSQGAPTDRPRPDRLLPRGEEPAEPTTTRGVKASTPDGTQGDNPLDALIERARLTPRVRHECAAIGWKQHSTMGGSPSSTAC